VRLVDDGVFVPEGVFDRGHVKSQIPSSKSQPLPNPKIPRLTPNSQLPTPNSQMPNANPNSQMPNPQSQPQPSSPIPTSDPLTPFGIWKLGVVGIGAWDLGFDARASSAER
jgi:hypothetical protein